MPYTHKRSIRVKTLRRIAGIIQAILIIGIPFIKIKGESALRFDIPMLRLHVFGYSIWMQEFFIVLIATIFLTLLIVFVTLVFGRIWCGWLCPQTVLVDFTPFVDRAKKKGLVYRLFAFAVTFIISIIVAVSLIWYFVSPYEFIPALMRGDLGTTTWGFWIVLTVIIFLNYAFLRHKWCATVCPYARLQGVMFDQSTLIIEVDPKRADECIDCKRCEKVCPTDVKIREGLNASCINCAECLDACNDVMARRGKKGLIHYAFGTAGEGRILRQNFFIVGGFTLVFFVFLVYLVSSRMGIDFTILPHNMEARITKDGSILNAYVLSIKNMRNEPVDLQVSVEGFNETVSQSINEPIHIKAGGSDRLPLFVRAKDMSGLKTTKKIKIILIDKKRNISIVRETSFIVPDDV